MPRSTDPRKYPPQFRAIIRRALAEGSVEVPVDSGQTRPASLRTYLQSYLNALGDADPEFGSLPLTLMVKAKENGVVVCDRKLSILGASLDEASKGYLDDDILGAGLPST